MLATSIDSFNTTCEHFAHLIGIGITRQCPPISCGLTSYFSGSDAREWDDTVPPGENPAALLRWRIVRILQMPLSTGLSRCCGYTDLHLSWYLWYVTALRNSGQHLAEGTEPAKPLDPVQGAQWTSGAEVVVSPTGVVLNRWRNPCSCACWSDAMRINSRPNSSFLDQRTTARSPVRMSPMRSIRIRT